MTIMINGYEVEIKAKHRYSEKFNKHDTMAVLNQIAIWAGESAELDSMRGLNGMARTSHEANIGIYNELNKRGYYKNLA